MYYGKLVTYFEHQIRLELIPKGNKVILTATSSNNRDESQELAVITQATDDKFQFELSANAILLVKEPVDLEM